MAKTYTLKHTALVGTVEDVSGFLKAADRLNVHVFSPERGGGWKALLEETGVGYSRGWLILRTADLEANAPELITPMSEMLAEQAAKGKDTESFVAWFAHRIVVPMRDDQALSWGEISV